MNLETEHKENNFSRTKHSFNLNKSIYADAEYVEEATKNKADTVLIDSRERLNYLTEHIPSAKNIPYTMLGSGPKILRNTQEIKRFIENRGISPDSEIITYCGSVGTLSGLAYYALKMAGLEKVKLYPKSFREWKQLGKPKQEFKDATFWDLSAE
jgi:thiosulfate/3-mercaptopyruvate sulfurtransferase